MSGSMFETNNQKQLEVVKKKKVVQKATGILHFPTIERNQRRSNPTLSCTNRRPSPVPVVPSQVPVNRRRNVNFLKYNKISQQTHLDEPIQGLQYRLIASLRQHKNLLKLQCC